MTHTWKQGTYAGFLRSSNLGKPSLDGFTSELELASDYFRSVRVGVMLFENSNGFSLHTIPAEDSAGINIGEVLDFIEYCL